VYDEFALLAPDRRLYQANIDCFLQNPAQYFSTKPLEEYKYLKETVSSDASPEQAASIA